MDIWKDLFLEDFEFLYDYSILSLLWFIDEVHVPAKRFTNLRIMRFIGSCIVVVAAWDYKMDRHLKRSFKHHLFKIIIIIQAIEF